MMIHPKINTDTKSCCCSNQAQKKNHIEYSKAEKRPWDRRYFLILAMLVALWWLVYSFLALWTNRLVFDLFGFPQNSLFGASLEFFLYDTIKILMLLVALIYGIAWIRAAMDMERIREFLSGKGRGFGYFLGAIFGSVTPFCSCSSIPLFLGFTTARIPMGITMSFLITSPLINEVAIVLLWSLLGLKFTLIYVLVGIAAGMLGGLFMDAIRAERWLQPYLLESRNKLILPQAGNSSKKIKLSIRERHDFAWSEMSMIFKKVWKWVLIGVAIGAGLHGFVPDNWFAEHLGAGQWWTVPIAVFAAIPLYSNVTGIVPVMESLLVKGLPLGTTLAFCMSAVAASIPEVMMLRQIMTIKLQVVFILYLWIIFTLAGWLFNALGPFIF